MPLNLSITDADIAYAQSSLGCSFSNERREVLKCNTSIDIQAGPGTGKTTLLVAKLAILARKWTWRDRGICVLSHTNVARDEVEKRLSRHPTGHRLLTYPHFIGTMQAFVDQYLALPRLRSLGIELSRIDNEWFQENVLRLAHGNRFTRVFLEKRPNTGPAAISSLRFEGSTLRVGSSVQNLPGENTATHQALLDIKKHLLLSGVCRYDDMYAFAQAYLAECPSIENGLRFRFPWVFVDEMQDTNGLQDVLLTRLYSHGCVLQRFGDINQAIFSDEDTDESGISFPKIGCIEVRDSIRFGHEIASQVSCLTAVAPQQLTGNPAIVSRRHTVFLFDDCSIQCVMPAFGDLLAQEYANTVPTEFKVKAIGFRRKPATSEEQHRLPHAISDYWADFQPVFVSKSSPQRHLVDYVRLAQDVRSMQRECAESYAILMDGILQLLLIQQARTDKGERFTRSRLVDALDRSDRLPQYQELVRHLCLDVRTVTSGEWPSIVEALTSIMGQWLHGGLAPKAQSFIQWVDRCTGMNATTSQPPRQNVFRHKGMDIEVTTIHGVKGETHTATLVLETFWKGKHDLHNVLPYLLNGRGSSLLGNNLREQMKRVFVAMTRPRELLCLAMHADHLEQGYADTLRSRGWCIQDLRREQ